MTGRTASPATSTHLLAGAEAVGKISGQQHCESQVLGGGGGVSWCSQLCQSPGWVVWLVPGHWEVMG